MTEGSEGGRGKEETRSGRCKGGRGDGGCGCTPPTGPSLPLAAWPSEHSTERHNK